MSKTETVKRLSTEQSAPARNSVRTEAERQKELSDMLEQIATDVTNLNEEHKATLQRLRREREALTSSLDEAHQAFQEKTAQASESMSADLEKAQNSAANTRQELRTAIKGVQPTVSRIEASAKRISVMTMITDVAFGMLLGAICMTALAIWQPQLLEAAWRAAETLGTT